MGHAARVKLLPHDRAIVRSASAPSLLADTYVGTRKSRLVARDLPGGKDERCWPGRLVISTGIHPERSMGAGPSLLRLECIRHGCTGSRERPRRARIPSSSVAATKTTETTA